MAVPLFELKTQHALMRADLDSAVARVLDSGQFILGPEVEAFERELAGAVGAAYAVGMTSGTDALLVGLQALDVGPGDEVVTTPFTFFATAAVVSRLGARPVFADIEPAGFTIDVAAALAAVTPRTRAIVPVHLFGQCADMDGLLAGARGAGVRILEDAAQSIGATYRGRQSAAIGDVGALSFFPTKNLGGLGDAGAAVTSDQGLAKRLRSLRVHGQSETYRHEEIGINGRLDALQAAFLRAKLPRLEQWNDARRRNAARYAALFAEAGLAGTVTLPAQLPGNRHVYHQYVIRAPRRDELRKHLTSKGIGAAVYYPLPLHLQPCFSSLGYREGAFPVAERAAREVLALPVYPELTEAMQAEVVAGIRAFYAG